MVSTAQIITAIDTDTGTPRQILTDDEYTANAYKYTGAGAPGTGGRPTVTGRTLADGDLYIDTTTMVNNLYFYSNDAWHQASAATLEDIGDVYLTNPQADDHLVYNPRAGNAVGDTTSPALPGWHNQTATQISGRNILLESLMDVQADSRVANQVLIRNTANTHWINVDPSVLAGHIPFSALSDIPDEPTTGEPRVLRWDPTANSGAGAWSYTIHDLNSLSNVTATSVDNGEILYWNGTNWTDTDVALLLRGGSGLGNGVSLHEHVDVTTPTAPNQFLRWNNTTNNWDTVLLSAAAEVDGTGGIALENLNNVNNTGVTDNDILVYNGGEWSPQRNTRTAAAILDNNGMPELATGITASEIRTLIGEGEEGFLVNFQLTRGPGVFNGGSWAGATTGVLTHSAISTNPRVYLNGTLLQPTIDYTVDDAANTVTLVANIRNAIEDTNNWCISIVDSVDSSTAGTIPTLAGSLNYVGPNFVSHTVTETEYTAAVDDTVDMTVSGTISDPSGTQVATYDVVYIPGPPSAGDIEIRVTPIEGWTVESLATQNFDRNPDNSYRHRFSLPAAATTFRVVELIDTGLFFDPPNNYAREKLSNEPVTNTVIDSLGYTRTDVLDSRFQPIQDNSNPLITQTALATALNSYVTTDTLSTTLPVAVTRGDTFPLATVAQDGDQHFLTTNIYAPGTQTNPVNRSGTLFGSTTLTETQVPASDTDPITGENVVAGLVEITQEMESVPNMNVSETVSGATTYGLSNRNHAFSGFHLSRLVNAGGGTTNAIYVTETMGNTVTYNNEVVQGATWYNVHIRVQSGNALGLAQHVINDASYVFIDFGTPALNVNTRLTADTAIDTMLGYLSNDSALTAGLVHNTNVASSITTRGTYTGGTIMVSRAQPDRLTSVYSFIPQNGFSIDTTSNRTFITGNTVTVNPNGRVLERIAGGVVSWQVTFARTYQVPTGTPTPRAREGQYIYDNGWRQVSLALNPVDLT